MVIGMLGILKSGGAYVAIDPNYPEHRIKYMLKDSRATVLLTMPDLINKIPFKGTSVNLTGKEIAKFSGENLKQFNGPEDLAYIIYTSGSSGRPKGVAIEHGNISAFIHWCNQEFKNTRFNVVFAATSYSFDLSVFELFYPLQRGKMIRLLRSGLEIGQYIDKETSILINTVPTVIRQLINSGVRFNNIVAINMAGEPIAPSIIDKLPLNEIEVRNLYGPSEDTTYSTCYELKEKKTRQIIGKPISNTKVYILNECRELVPIGLQL